MSTATNRTSTGKRAVILLRTADRNVMARQRLRQAARRLQERLPETTVLAAYVQEPDPATTTTTASVAEPAGSVPALGTAVEQLVGQGVKEIAIVPYDVEWSYPELYDVPDLLHDLAEEFPSARFRLARPLGLGTDLVHLVAHRVEEGWALPPIGTATVREVAAIAGQTPLTTATLRPGELPKLPAHAQHVFVCFGRRCMEQGSAASFAALNEALAAHGLDDGPQRVKVSRSKCLSPCQAAPVACLYPDGTFYSQLDAATMPRFVEEVLAGGGTLPGHTFRPGE